MKSKFSAYVELAKPGIIKMVLVTTALGFFLAKKDFSQIGTLIITLIGTALSCGGSGALNHYLERDIDCKMKRTANRPIPSGTIAAADALSYGITLVLLGTTILVAYVNVLTGFLALLTAFLYIFVYTPLKRITWWNTFIGAIPGAIPPLGGWAAACGHLDLGAWVLFAILFVWQHPHFYAIAWMYKDDYKQAGFKMLPVVDPSGVSTFRQIILYSIILIPISLLPSFINMSSWLYFSGALVLGIFMLLSGLKMTRIQTTQAARGLLRCSIVYLPMLFVFIVMDAILIG